MSTESRTVAGVKPMSPARTLALATIGNLLEWYDFTVYAVTAVYIAQTFFKPDDSLSALLSTFAIFAIAFVARPLGAFLLGPLVDRRGRKFVMLLSMFIMAGGSLLIGLAPSYSVAGSLGAVILVLGRLAQGFSAGGEFGSAAVFMVEWAGSGRRGFFGSFHQVATYGGLLLAVSVTFGLTAVLGPVVMAAGGWRVPFLLGALLAIVVLILRVRMGETPVFEEQKNEESTETCSSEQDLSPAAGFFLTIGVIALWTGAAMVTLNFMPAYGVSFLGLPPQLVLVGTAIGAALSAVLIPFAGKLSDRVGRKPLLIFSAVGYVIVSIPLFTLMTSTKEFWALVVAQLVFALFSASIAGVGAATITELFTTRRRGTLVSIGSAIATAVFGGFGTYVCTWLIGVTGTPVAPAYYLLGVAVITVVAALFLPGRMARENLRR